DVCSSNYYEKALTYYSKIENMNNDMLFKYGFIASQINRNDIAINSWEKLIEQDPDYHSVYTELAKVYQLEGMNQEAYDLLKKSLKIDEFNKERSEEHTSELQSRFDLVCRLLLEKKKK